MCGGVHVVRSTHALALPEGSSAVRGPAQQGARWPGSTHHTCCCYASPYWWGRRMHANASKKVMLVTCRGGVSGHTAVGCAGFCGLMARGPAAGSWQLTTRLARGTTAPTCRVNQGTRCRPGCVRGTRTWYALCTLRSSATSSSWQQGTPAAAVPEPPSGARAGVPPVPVAALRASAAASVSRRAIRAVMRARLMVSSAAASSSCSIGFGAWPCSEHAQQGWRRLPEPACTSARCSSPPPNPGLLYKQALPPQVGLTWPTSRLIWSTAQSKWPGGGCCRLPPAGASPSGP